MKDISSENLSVKLFAEPKHVIETSSIINHLANSPELAQNGWYRVLHKASWSWLGIDPILIEHTLAKISASTNERSHEKLLDTVYGYRSGNWSYEWTQAAMELQKEAENELKANQLEKATQKWFEASCCFCVGAYPYLKGDPLSTQALIMANKTFQQALRHYAYKVIEVAAKVEGKTVKGYLYLPHTNACLPTVIVSGGFDFQQIEFSRFFETYFAPANLAVLTLDMPSIGQSSNLYLTENTSKVHQAFLQSLIDIPWVDQDRIGCLGFGMGANAAVRMAFVESQKVKACVSVGGILHTLLDKMSQHKLAKELVDKVIEPMRLDSLASCMGWRQVDTNLLTNIKSLSLKHQGLLTGRRTQVPILAIRLANDVICPEADNELAALYSAGGKARSIKPTKKHDDYHVMMQEAIAWFNEKL